MVIATFVDYDGFKAAFQKWGPSPKNTTVFKSTLAGTPSAFTAAIVAEDGVVLRMFIESEPATFTTDFPQAIVANTVVSS